MPTSKRTVTMTEKELKEMGFEFDRTYSHGDYTTKVFEKGVIRAEITRIEATGEFNSFDIAIEEVAYLQITKEDLKHLVRILEKA